MLRRQKKRLETLNFIGQGQVMLVYKWPHTYWLERSSSIHSLLFITKTELQHAKLSKLTPPLTTISGCLMLYAVKAKTLLPWIGSRRSEYEQNSSRRLPYGVWHHVGLCVDTDISLAHVTSMSTTTELRPSGRLSDAGKLMVR